MKNCSFRELLLYMSVTLVVMLSSCAYYNSYYNAEKLFESAQKRALNAQGKPQASSIDEYNKVIKKCGFIIYEYKNSKWVDDAVFLMGRAFYYRGNNQIQALEKFEELIMYYPDSPHFKDAILYSARVKFELNEKEDAYEILRNFIKNQNYQNDHDKALLLLADLYISEKDYIQAQFYLTMLIDKFPKSKSFASAYILLGKTFFDNENYQKSLETFTEITQKKVPKGTHNDALFYIAFNQFHLHKFQDAYHTINGLIKKEYRLDKVNEQNILLARIIAELNNPEEAIEKLQTVVSNTPRTMASAEATFFVAEIYFLKLNNYESAIENYNNVRRESSQSPYVEKAVTRSAVVSQIVQYYRLDSNISAEKLIAEQFKLAEYYLYELSQPDSAMVIYDKIHIQKEFLIIRIDSLKTFVNEWLLQNPEAGIDAELTDLSSESHDAEHVLVDNFTYEEDILELIEKAEVDDVLNHDIEEPVDVENLKILLATYEHDLELYNEQFIPQTMFVQMVVFRQFYGNEERVQYFYDILKSEYPENRFTEAAYEFMNGQIITFRSSLEKEQFDKYDYAMSYYLKGEDIYKNSIPYIINILKPLTKTDVEGLAEKSNFTLGFIYYFDVGDSLTAKTYLDSLLNQAPTSEYATFTKKFYDGEKFILDDRLPSLVDEDFKKAEKDKEDALAKQQESEKNINETESNNDNTPEITSGSELQIEHEELQPLPEEN